MAWFGTERLSIESVTRAVNTAADKLPLAGILSRGFDWVYERALGGAPGLDGAEAVAADYRARHDDDEAAIAQMIAWHTGQAGAAGFLTGMGGALTLPVAMPAHLLSTLYLQVRLTAAIAHLRGYDIRSDEVRLAAFACLAGATAADRLKQAGIAAGAPLVQQAVAKLPGELFKNFGGILGSHLAGRAGRHGVMRLLPLFGGVVSGGFDAAATRVIGDAAKRVFPARPGAEEILPADRLQLLGARSGGAMDAVEQDGEAAGQQHAAGGERRQPAQADRGGPGNDGED